MKKATVIISDIHGNYEALEELLFRTEIINAKGVRRTDKRYTVVQIGDLANCVKESVDGDLLCLEKVGDWIDFVLMGNHEIPYFDSRNYFSGFYNDAGSVRDKLFEIEERNLLLPAFFEKGILVTHAGWDKDNHPYITEAIGAYDFICRKLETGGWNNRIFSDVGYIRGGNSNHGGILWEDFRDLRSPFPQIVGHTNARIIRNKENAICIDTGARSGDIGIPTAILI